MAFLPTLNNILPSRIKGWWRPVLLNMKKTTFAIIASGLAAITIGLAAPAVAAPSGNGNGGGHDNSVSVYPNQGQTAYGTYQNSDKRGGR
jgi:hypothetical protein